VGLSQGTKEALCETAGPKTGDIQYICLASSGAIMWGYHTEQKGQCRLITRNTKRPNVGLSQGTTRPNVLFAKGQKTAYVCLSLKAPLCGLCTEQRGLLHTVGLLFWVVSVWGKIRLDLVTSNPEGGRFR
jgi:hypothetical protein